MSAEEIYREPLPYLNEAGWLVGVREKREVVLKVVYRDPNGCEFVRAEIARFKKGYLDFFSEAEPAWFDATKGTVFALSDAERLCMMVLPREFMQDTQNITRMPRVMADPFWQSVLSFFAAEHVMES